MEYNLPINLQWPVSLCPRAKPGGGIIYWCWLSCFPDGLVGLLAIREKPRPVRDWWSRWKGLSEEFPPARSPSPS